MAPPPPNSRIPVYRGFNVILRGSDFLITIDVSFGGLIVHVVPLIFI